MSRFIESFHWVGSVEDFIDNPVVELMGENIAVGRYGGNSHAGQTKNEDGCLIWTSYEDDWEFTLLLDAHNTAESAELVIDQFLIRRLDIESILSRNVTRTTFANLESKVLSVFQSEQFLTSCRKVTGETACLIVARKDKFVWWFSIGDCLFYLFQPDLAELGQFQLNQRQFYEWVGKVNTFEQDVPCYSSGTRELRKGSNLLLLTTDGLVECPEEPFRDPMEIMKIMYNHECIDGIKFLLETVRKNNVKDNTTIISWKVEILEEGSQPSL